jgi:hypothetical protein
MAMVKSASVTVLILVLCGIPAPGQTNTGNASTKGPCSPATSGSNNNFVIKCGIGQEQGKKIIDMLNAALASHDDSTINAKLDELLALATKPSPILLSATISKPTDITLSVENKSDRVARDVGWEVVVFRESDGAMFSFPTQSIGYLKPLATGPSYVLKLENLPKSPPGNVMQKGDVLTGFLTIDCPDCMGIRYIVHLVSGQSGWQYEMKRLPHIGIATQVGASSLDANKLFIQELLNLAPVSERVPIL